MILVHRQVTLIKLKTITWTNLVKEVLLGNQSRLKLIDKVKIAFYLHRIRNLMLISNRTKFDTFQKFIFVFLI
jgi:hypothetical protein